MRHIFKMRCGYPSHWEIRRVMVRLLEEVQKLLPGIFDDFEWIGEHRGIPYYKQLKKEG
jgi:thymidylate synthase ThyX